MNNSTLIISANSPAFVTSESCYKYTSDLVEFAKSVSGEEAGQRSSHYVFDLRGYSCLELEDVFDSVCGRTDPILSKEAVVEPSLSNTCACKCAF